MISGLGLQPWSHTTIDVSVPVHDLQGFLPTQMILILWYAQNSIWNVLFSALFSYFSSASLLQSWTVSLFLPKILHKGKWHIYLQCSLFQLVNMFCIFKPNLIRYPGTLANKQSVYSLESINFIHSVFTLHLKRWYHEQSYLAVAPLSNPSLLKLHLTVHKQSPAKCMLNNTHWNAQIHY